MTEKEAKAILETYQETDEDTGEIYGYEVLDCLGTDGDGFVFECRAEGAENTCDMGIYPDGTILNIPR